MAAICCATHCYDKLRSYYVSPVEFPNAILLFINIVYTSQKTLLLLKWMQRQVPIQQAWKHNAIQLIGTDNLDS